MRVGDSLVGSIEQKDKRDDSMSSTLRLTLRKYCGANGLHDEENYHSTDRCQKEKAAAETVD